MADDLRTNMRIINFKKIHKQSYLLIGLKQKQSICGKKCILGKNSACKHSEMDNYNIVSCIL